MKKLISLIALCLAGSLAYAGPVSPGKALQVAQRVFDSCSPATRSAGLRIVWDGEFEPATRSGEEPAFYVVGRDAGGFVMVAGHDNVEPVLAISLENPFRVEGMPCNVKAWMEGIKAYCRSEREATPEIREKWAALLETRGKIDPVVTGLTNEFKGSRTNLWNQTNPANYYCPDIPGEDYTTVCGCVALSTIEVMAWYGTDNLAALSGTVPGYTYTSDYGYSVTIPEHELGTVYDWENLHTLASEAQGQNENNYYNQVTHYSSGSYTYPPIYYFGQNRGTTLTPLGENLGHLAYDVATLLKANFNFNYGTSAVFAAVTRNVAPVIGYNNGARYRSKANYPRGQWEQMLMDEITLHPVLYDGRSTDDAGHAYVADGFAYHGDDLMFHFNMGWGGSCNGYYFTDHQDDYELELEALFDFYPNPSASDPVGAMGYYGSQGGLAYTSGYNSKTLSFTIRYLSNVGTDIFNGGVYAGLVTPSGTAQDYSSSATVSVNLQPNYYYSSISRTVTMANASLGCRLALFYKASGSNEYLPVLAGAQMAYPAELPFFPAAFIKTDSEYHVGDYLIFELFNQSYDYSNTTWYITNPEGTRAAYTAEDYRVLLESAGEYKIEALVPDQETIVSYITVTP